MPQQHIISQDIDRVLEQARSRDVNWHELFHIAKALTLQSAKEEVRRKPFTVKDFYMNLLAWLAPIVLLVASFALPVFGVVDNPIANDAPATLLNISLVIGAIGGMFGSAMAIVLGLPEALEKKKSVNKQLAKIHAPSPVRYSATLKESAEHAGGIIVIKQTIPVSAFGNDLKTDAKEVATLPLGLCDVGEMSEIMTMVTDKLSQKQLQENVEYYETLIDNKWDSANAENTLALMVDQCKLIAEHNHINKGAFSVINEQVEEELARQILVSKQDGQTATSQL